MRTRRIGDIVILTPAGPLWDDVTVAALSQAVTSLLEAGSRVLVIDMSETTQLNSMCMSVLLSAHKAYDERGGHMVLCGVKEPARKLFVMLKTSVPFDVYESQEEAIVMLQPPLGRFPATPRDDGLFLGSLCEQAAQTKPPSNEADKTVLLEEVRRSEDFAESKDMVTSSRPRVSVRYSARTRQSRLVDEVQFGVASPTVMQPGSTCLIDVWAFSQACRAAVLERIVQEGQGAMQFRSKGPVRVARGSPLVVALHIAGLVVRGESTRSCSTILWDGTMGNGSFLVSVPSNRGHGSIPGEVAISVRGLRVARLLFSVTIGASTSPTVPVAFEERRHRTAFASYSSKDRSRVLSRVHGLQKAGVEVFIDVAGLRSGARYDRVLLEMIDSRDVFYLFWSKAASESKWVRYEWQTALQRRGLDYIDPFPLESPEKAPPPPELGRSLHFNDWILAYLEGQPEVAWWQFWSHRRQLAP